jgi:hypothetical protein
MLKNHARKQVENPVTFAKTPLAYARGSSMMTKVLFMISHTTHSLRFRRNDFCKFALSFHTILKAARFPFR